MCPRVTERRLHLDESLSCPEHIDPYFGVAAGFMFVSFVLGVPGMYYALIQGHCGMFTKVKCEGDTDSYELRCGHAFCHDCWKQYLEISIMEKGPQV